MNRREFLTNITALAAVSLLPINLIPKQNSYITDGKWHFLATVVNEGKAMYYIDGKRAKFLDTDFASSPCLHSFLY